ncbi:MAG: M20 family metallopeptidase [Verrucomicrobia bacterium]|nr:M20 family metallopeptidase [Verrucomicrobiota bacterium]
MRHFADVEQLIAEIIPEIVDLRHDLHAHPELAFEEFRTAAKVVDCLQGLSDLRIEAGFGGTTGVVVTLGADLSGPCMALRADMDALPLTEVSGVEYSSTVSGKMHACGHDGHTAMLVGVVKVLYAVRHHLRGPVKFIFQPAEEGGGGGKVLRDAGALQNPAVDAIFGLHNFPLPEYPANSIALCDGPFMAGSAGLHVTVKGKGGHAAAPHNCIDPIYVGAEIIQALQSLVSRRVSPLHPLVISVTRFNAGTANNIIPSEAVLSGTIRALDPVVLKAAHGWIQTCVQQTAAAHGATAEVVINDGYPPVVNHVRANRLLAEVAASIGWQDRILPAEPVMGGEDFAYYLENVPGAFWFLGSHPGGSEDVAFCHHPAYDFNDAVIATGIRLHVELALKFADLWPTI